MPNYWAVNNKNDSKMKKANQYTQKDVARKGYSIIYSVNNLLLHWPISRFKLDRRYNLNKEVIEFVRNHQLSFDEKRQILAIKRERAKSKASGYTTIYQRPLVKDWMKNKHDVKAIWDNLIQFYGRNHWAKDKKDQKILQVFKKYQK